MNPNHYGKEFTLDLHDCDVEKFTRKMIKQYFIELCDIIEMEREKLVFWDYYGDSEGYKNAPPKLKGISAVQFIKTSTITIHTLDLMQNVYLNIFSCKDFDTNAAKEFSQRWFRGKVINSHVMERR